MKNCEKFHNLTPLERAKMVGSIVHLLQVSNTIFKDVVILIKVGTESGFFDGVEIAPIKSIELSEADVSEG